MRKQNQERATVEAHSQKQGAKKAQRWRHRAGALKWPVAWARTNLYVAVDEAVGVHVLETECNLDQKSARLMLREAPLAELGPRREVEEQVAAAVEVRHQVQRRRRLERGAAPVQERGPAAERRDMREHVQLPVQARAAARLADPTLGHHLGVGVRVGLGVRVGVRSRFLATREGEREKRIERKRERKIGEYENKCEKQEREERRVDARRAAGPHNSDASSTLRA
jgi:hypothetical protein